MKLKQQILCTAALFLFFLTSACSIAENGPPGLLPAPEEQSPPSQEHDNVQPDEPDSGLQVHTGSTISMETTIEGMTEEVKVVEYTLTPAGIQYHLRVLMGSPSVEGGQVVYQRAMGEGTAELMVEVLEETPLEEAAGKAQHTLQQKGFTPGQTEKVPQELNGYEGTRQSFLHEDQIHGYYAFDIEASCLIIYYSYPAEAADGMGAVMHEMLQSISIED
ncbi:hypothetical protein [Paenibacillus lemnae]|uniref:Uncharacterized protein n=1 Tax=Paenibacillus lemnae TaxID=1330551 RepID=A0A848M5G2_PAELE|nr:hypothetical protein [Paenibacillus lemnae]NMO95043.1 hypothetical protein [Paenibacillus lemnae]